MKTTYLIYPLCLLTGFLVRASSLLAQQAQINDSYKQLGWVERSITVKNPGLMDTPTPEDILRSDKQSRETADRFKQRFPGRGKVRLTNDLLKTFDDTKGTTEGVYLFLGFENGQFVPMLVHTNINRETMLEPDGDRNPGYYEADFSKAYVWQPSGLGKLVWKLVQGKLKTRIRNSTNALIASDISSIKGYYLSKDALVKAWKQTGKKPLTLFFLLDGGEIHLALPYYPRKSSGLSPVKARLFYTNANLAGSVAKVHGSIRCCPSYCGGLDE